MSESISFDRAADYYDQTRALPPEAAEKIIAQLLDEIRGRGSCLEIGVGTGRIALPLMSAGADVVGIDLSAEMLGKLRAKTEGSPLPKLVQGDATRLPFRDETFGVVLTVWVLHLIRDWRSVLEEAKRVLRPGGVLLAEIGTGGGGTYHEVREHFRDVSGVDWPIGLSGAAELHDAMTELGAARRNLRPIVGKRVGRIEDTIGQLEAGMFSVSWAADEDTRKRAAAETRRWAAERYGSLTEERTIVSAFRWFAFDMPGK